MDNSLYLVTEEEYSGSRSTLDVAKSAISGGIDIIQMREKNKTPQELLFLGKELSRLCRKSNVTFIVNDDPYLAKEVAADGVHLGQEDLKKYPLEKSREILGAGKIIGISTHSVKEFKKASESSCDYIAFGPVFKTKTKDYAIGTGDVKEVLSTTDKPVVFIGGINEDNISEVLKEGARNVAMIRAITLAGDITLAVRSFKRCILGGVNQMGLRINGKNEKLEGKISLEALVSERGLDRERVVIEHNLDIIPRESWASVFLAEGDNVEIVKFMGGG